MVSKHTRASRVAPNSKLFRIYFFVSGFYDGEKIG